jgi:glutathione S-transferase
MTTKLDLFTSPSAFPNPQRLRIFMHEKGIADQFSEHVYDMTPVGEQRQWRHLKMNPWGETPTLKLADGSFISETAAIARYLDQSMPGRKIMGENPKEQGLDNMWDNRVWVHILYRIVTAFHVLHQGLGPKLELTTNHAWGEHCRKEALAHAALVNQHLSDGRDWILGGDAPDLLGHYDGNGNCLLQVSGQRDPAGRAFRPSGCFLAALAASSRLPGCLCRPQQRRAGTG